MPSHTYNNSKTLTSAQPASSTAPDLVVPHRLVVTLLAGT